MLENNRVIQVDQRPPLQKTIPLSLQHLFAMFGSTVLVPILFNVNPAIVLLFNGIGTLLYLFLCKGRIPAYLGSLQASESLKPYSSCRVPTSLMRTRLHLWPDRQHCSWEPMLHRLQPRPRGFVPLASPQTAQPELLT